MRETHITSQRIASLVLPDLFAEVACHGKATHRALVHSIATATTATTTATGEAIVVHVVCRENHRIELILLKAVHTTLHSIQIMDIVGRLLSGTSIA